MIAEVASARRAKGQQPSEKIVENSINRAHEIAHQCPPKDERASIIPHDFQAHKELSKRRAKKSFLHGIVDDQDQVEPG
jgi:hypothetical protein